MALSLNRQTVEVMAAEDADLEAAFNKLVDQKAAALFVGTDPFLTGHRERLVALAQRHAIPAVYPWREFVAAGGLMSYGTSITDVYRLIGIYTARILRGTKPAELPVLQPTKFELVINPQDREGAWSRSANVDPAARRRVDRIAVRRMSELGHLR